MKQEYRLVRESEKEAGKKRREFNLKVEEKWSNIIQQF